MSLRRLLSSSSSSSSSPNYYYYYSAVVEEGGNGAVPIRPLSSDAGGSQMNNNYCSSSSSSAPSALCSSSALIPSTSKVLDLAALLRREEELTRAMQQLEREKRELEAEKRKHLELRAKLGRRVDLNVGGRRFSTTITTLTAYPDSMLGRMFSGAFMMEPDVDGCFFIDRSGYYFEYIMDFLRDGRISIPTEVTSRGIGPVQEMERIKLEAEWFGLTPLVEFLDNAINLYW
eukprot:GEZU01021111.1.p1 GENE.GEZU01021111.1~~GEZU01021111.1.p1  ORF type:complete len:231 (-),score=45.23 GEZU01021111.1:30-722(-)